MILTTGQSLILILIITATTFLTRVIPFVIFPANKKTPRFVTYLGSVLPYAIIGMLIIYCLKNTVIVSYPYGLPEAISIAAVVAVHLWKRNTLVSIGIGTVIYMLLVQFIFV